MPLGQFVKPRAEEDRRRQMRKPGAGRKTPRLPHKWRLLVRAAGALSIAAANSSCSGARGYTRLILPTPDLALPPANSSLEKSPGPGNFSAKVGPTQPVTIGDILLCT